MPKRPVPTEKSRRSKPKSRRLTKQPKKSRQKPKPPIEEEVEINVEENPEVEIKEESTTPTPEAGVELEVEDEDEIKVEEEEISVKDEVVDDDDEDDDDDVDDNEIDGDLENNTTTSYPETLSSSQTSISPKTNKNRDNSSNFKSPAKQNNSIMTKPMTSTPISATSNASNALPNAKNKNRKRRESATSSDEERWLSAIESGKLEDVDDELKKIKDPKLMTARQRAMYERGGGDNEAVPGVEYLMSLPTGYREREKPTTAEEIQKAALKSQRRKQQADEKREKDKKRTMERLLKKQDSKQRSAGRNKSVKAVQPMIIYKNTTEGAVILMPPDFDFPLKPQKQRDPPKPKFCGIEGCNRIKVYNCSKTNVPLCSYECYLKNFEDKQKIDELIKENIT